MSARRLVATGTKGQVATALLGQDWPGWEVAAVGRPAIDLARAEGLLPALEAAAPDVVVNVAAHTDVEGSEDEADLAMAVNATGAEAVAKAARELGVPVIQISTDYVFDGRAGRPYREDDQTAPLNVYGRSKLEGERLVAAAHPDHAILRASWVYAPDPGWRDGPRLRNFVLTMLRLATSRDAVDVVSDQHGAPTHAADLARAILRVADVALGAEPAQGEWRGVTHVAPGGHATWADVAGAVFESSAALGGPSAEVRPVSSDAFKTRARRPVDSRLDTSRLREVFGLDLPHWRDGVERCVRSCLEGARP